MCLTLGKDLIRMNKTRRCPHTTHSLIGRHQGGTQAGPLNRARQSQGKGVYKLLREPKGGGTYLSMGWGWVGL